MAGKKKDRKVEAIVEIPKDCDIRLDGNMVITKGKKGEASKELSNPKIKIVVEPGMVKISCDNALKRDYAKVNAFKAHIKNLIRGCQEGHTYKLKICSGHFPMNVAVGKNELSVKNFLGEKVPRVVKLGENVDVKIEGEIINIDSCSKEIAGQTAADIENLCKITNKDLRIFQDGIWVIEKDGKEIK